MKKSQEVLSEQYRFLQTLIDAIPVPVFYKDREGVYLGCNKAFAQFLSKTKKDIIGKKVCDLLPKELAREYRDMDKELFNNPGVQMYESEINHADGTRHAVIFRKATYTDTSGKVSGLIGTINDITDLRTVQREKVDLEKQFLHVQKIESLGTLAGGVAHDFNNILMSVIGYTELALNTIEKDSVPYEFLKEVLKAGHRAKELVKHILAFSRCTEQELKPINICPVIEEVLTLIRSTLPSTIEIKKSYDIDCDTVIADPTQIHQIIMNLCTNAAHAMQEQGGILEICLKTFHIDKTMVDFFQGLLPGNYLKLTVSDTGCGITVEDKQKIFAPYFTTKVKGKGTGLGLSVVLGIVRNYGGHITCTSEIGQGTNFNVYLPLLEETVVKREHESVSIPRGIEHILVVDDESSVDMMEKFVLQGLGYKVTAKTSSTEALADFKTSPHSFDAVITDMTMPQITGERLVQEIRAIHPTIPVILCTGYSEKITPERAALIGIDQFLLKPLNMLTLARSIRKVIDMKKKTDSLLSELMVNSEL